MVPLSRQVLELAALANGKLDHNSLIWVKARGLPNATGLRCRLSSRGAQSPEREACGSTASQSVVVGSRAG
jgi:hypothetical protein